MYIKKMFSKYKFIIIISSFLILSIISSLFLFKTHYIFGASDISFHLKRIFELKESLKNGVILPESSFNYYHGSASMILYPYINLLPIVFLSFLIKSSINLIYVSFIITELCALLISFLSSFYYNKSYKISYVFSVIYCMSIMFISYGFCSMDLGVLTVLTILPLVLFGFLSFLRDNKWLELSFGISFIVFSHVLSIFIVIGILCLWTLFNIKLIDKNKLFNLVKITIGVGLLTSIVWVPAIYFSAYNLTDIVSQANTQMMGISFYNLLKTAFCNKISYNLTIFPLIALILSIIYYKKFTKYLKQMLWISVILILFSSNLFPWGLSSHGVFKILGLFQFTWRFYIIPQVFLSYIFSVILIKYIKYKQNYIRNIVIIVALILSLSLQFLGQKEIINQNINSPIINRSYINKHLYNAIIHVNNTKYLPRPLYKLSKSNQVNYLSHFNAGPSFDYYPKNSINKMYYINDNRAYINHHNNIKLIHFGFNKYKFYCKHNMSNSKLHLPFLSYNNEHLKMYLNSHNKIYDVDSHSMITLKNIKRGQNTLIIKHVSNWKIVIIKNVMFILGILFYLYVFIRKFRY